MAATATTTKDVYKRQILYKLLWQNNILIGTYPAFLQGFLEKYEKLALMRQLGAFQVNMLNNRVIMLDFLQFVTYKACRCLNSSLC